MNFAPIGTALATLAFSGAVFAQGAEIFKGADLALGEKLIAEHKCAQCHASKVGGDGSAKSRAEANRWLAFFNADVHPAFHPVFGSTQYLGDAAMIELSKDHARQKLRGLFERADAQLQGRDWLTGTRSIADPYLFVTLRWAKAINVDLSGLANLERFFQRMLADEGVRAALQAEGLA